MEKINESIVNYEKSISKELQLNSSSELNENLDTLKTIVNNMAEKIEYNKKFVDSRDLLSDPDAKYNDFKQEITEKFSNLINSTKLIYENWKRTTSPKEILILIFDKFFQEYSAEKVWGIDIYNELIDDIKFSLEFKLVDEIENEVLKVRGNIEEIEKIPQVLQISLTEIQDFITKIKETTSQGTNKSKNETIEEFYSEIENLYGKFSQICNQFPIEINNKMAVFHETNSRFLSNLQKEIKLVIQEDLLKIRELEAKVTELTNELEKSKREASQKAVEVLEKGTPVETTTKASKTKRVIKAKKK